MTGGPLARNRTFFMVSYEGLHQNSFSELLTTVPTALERSGDFSQTRGSNGQSIVIYDPLTTCANPSGSGFVRDAFPGNVISRDRMDPVALNILRYWPEPNQAGDPGTGKNKFYASGAAKVNTDNFDLRIDQVLGTNRRLFGRYSYRRSYDAPPQLFPGETGVAEGRVNLNDWGRNVVFDYADQVWAAIFSSCALASRGTASSTTTRGSAFRRPASACRRASKPTSIARYSPPSASPMSSPSAATTIAPAASTPTPRPRV
jgi:hypothetical protein